MRKSKKQSYNRIRRTRNTKSTKRTKRTRTRRSASKNKSTKSKMFHRGGADLAKLKKNEYNIELHIDPIEILKIECLTNPNQEVDVDNKIGNIILEGGETLPLPIKIHTKCTEKTVTHRYEDEINHKFVSSFFIGKNKFRDPKTQDYYMPISVIDDIIKPIIDYYTKTQKQLNKIIILGSSGKTYSKKNIDKKKQKKIKQIKDKYKSQIVSKNKQKEEIQKYKDTIKILEDHL